VAVEVTKKGASTLTIPHIAALAGVSETTVRNAMREAQGLGFVRIEERRLTAWRNAPCRVTITSPEWTAWLRLGRRGEGAKPCTPRIQEFGSEPVQRENRAGFSAKPGRSGTHSVKRSSGGAHA
jgi:hypothetical protein